jgi:hypothetical protein
MAAFVLKVQDHECKRELNDQLAIKHERIHPEHKTKP